MHVEVKKKQGKSLSFLRISARPLVPPSRQAYTFLSLSLHTRRSRLTYFFIFYFLCNFFQLHSVAYWIDIITDRERERLAKKSFSTAFEDVNVEYLTSLKSGRVSRIDTKKIFIKKYEFSILL